MHRPAGLNAVEDFGVGVVRAGLFKEFPQKDGVMAWFYLDKPGGADRVVAERMVQLALTAAEMLG
jgi:hypothetical protein